MVVFITPVLACLHHFLNIWQAILSNNMAEGKLTKRSHNNINSNGNGCLSQFLPLNVIFYRFVFAASWSAVTMYEAILGKLESEMILI